MSTTMSHKDPEEELQREYRERTKKVSADRLLPYEIYRLRLAVEKFSDNSGKWLGDIGTVLQTGLAAIALAASTPEDNSAEVKELAERIRKQVELLRSAEQQSQHSK